MQGVNTVAWAGGGFTSRAWATLGVEMVATGMFGELNF